MEIRTGTCHSFNTTTICMSVKHLSDLASTNHSFNKLHSHFELGSFMKKGEKKDQKIQDLIKKRECSFKEVEYKRSECVSESPGTV